MIKQVKPIMPKQKKIVLLLKKNGVVKAGLFGSYARKENNKKSDIDILVKFKGRKSLLDLAGLELQLEKDRRGF